jgi:hypothetical protein
MAQRKTTTTRSTKKTATEIVDSVKAQPQEDDKVKKVRVARQAKAIADSSDVTIDKVATSLTKAQLDIVKTLDSVREMFASELDALSTIKEAIEAKQEELEALYDKEVVAASLRDLVLKHEAHMEEWTKSTEETRQSWFKEQDDHRMAVKERDERLLKQRTQEQEEYEYNKRIARKYQEEEWKNTLLTRKREQEETAAALEKVWKEREETLKKKEVEVEASKAKLDNFDADVKKEVDKQVAIIGNRMKSDYETKAQIAALEHEKERSLLAHDNNVLKSLVKAKDEEIDKLRAALEKKDNEVTKVAVAAMEAQSGKQALAAVQEAVQSQGKGK